VIHPRAAGPTFENVLAVVWLVASVVSRIEIEHATMLDIRESLRRDRSRSASWPTRYARSGSWQSEASEKGSEHETATYCSQAVRAAALRQYI
jgi:hypothetical protein